MTTPFVGLRSPRSALARWLLVTLVSAIPWSAVHAGTAGHLTQLTFEAASDTVNPDALAEATSVVGPCTRATTGCASGLGCYRWNPSAQPCNLKKTISSQTVVRAFLRFNVHTYPTGIFAQYPDVDVFGLYELAFGTNVNVQFTNTNQLRLVSTGSGGVTDVCGPLATPIALDTWYGLQFRAQKSETATASLDLLNDEGTVLDTISCSNMHAGGGSFTTVLVGSANGFGASGDIRFDDVDVHSDAGWPGNVRWLPLEPTDNSSCGGTMTGCSGSGNQWQCVDEDPPSDGDGSYISSGSTACRFKHDDAASRGIRNPIHGTLLWWNAKEVGGDATMSGRIDTADVGAQALTSSYGNYFATNTTDPVSGNPWTVAMIDDATFGYHRTSSGTAYVSANRWIVGYEQHGFTSPDPALGDEYGKGLGTAAGYVAVGAPGQSRVYVYDHGSRALLRIIDSPTASTTDRFGAAITSIGKDLYIGAPLADTAAGTDAGAVYVFDGLTGSLIRTILKNSGAAAGDRFGGALAAYSDSLIVGADGDDTSGTDVGAAFLFSADGTWIANFYKPSPSGASAFGSVVGVAGTYILVGDPEDGTGAGNSGAVFVFDGNIFSAQYKQLVLSLYNPTPQSNDAFGSAVGGISNRFVIGAPGDNTGASDAGSAYLFDALRYLGPGATNPNPNWGTLRTTINNPTAAANDRFGSSVADLRGIDAVIGAPFDDTSATNGGAAYRFSATGTLLETYVSSAGGADELFGAALGGGRHVLVGAFDTGPTAAPGSAYLFEKPIASCSVSGTYAQIGAWSTLEARPDEPTHSMLTSDSRVLFYGAGPRSGGPTSTFTWDATTHAIEQQPSTSKDLFCAGHAVLADGKPIVIGGTLFVFDGIKTTFVFDPSTETWSQKSDMAEERWYPTATTLQDGHVLAMSGQHTASPQNLATVPEIYDPSSNTWTTYPTAELTRPLYPFMFVLPNGKVLQAGADAGDLQTHTIDFTQASPTWTALGNSHIPGGSAVMYRPGKVLKSGGTAPPVDDILATAETIDMTAAMPTWTTTASMAYGRLHHNLVLLADGTVLAVGGASGDDNIFADDLPADAVLAAERWNPTTGTWSTMACMAHPRMYHSSALLLPDARVLVQGGNGYPSAQIYSPPYLFAGTRPTITSAPTSATYNTAFTVSTPSTGISSVALVRPGAVTHAFDQNQRYVPLSFTTTGGGLSVTAPVDGATAPPGDYMLFIVNSSGVPSTAKFIRLGP